MGYTVNQVRHFYVAKSVKTPVVSAPRTHLVEGTAKVGDLQAQINKDKDHVYFEYVSPAGIVRSDLINLSKIDYVKVTDKVELRTPLKVYEVSSNEANPEGRISLTVRLSGLQSASTDSDINIMSHYETKKGGEPISDVLKELAWGLFKSLEKSIPNTVRVSLDATPLLHSTQKASLSGTYTKIVIEEMPQPWNLRLAPTQSINIEVYGVVNDGAEFEMDVKKLPEDRSTKFIPNGTKIADMEYHYHGARGDMKRYAGYPYVMDTEYVADPTKEYYTLDLHYHFSDQGISSYHSEKDITIASEDKDALNAIAQAIKAQAEAVGSNIRVYDEC